MTCVEAFGQDGPAVTGSVRNSNVMGLAEVANVDERGNPPIAGGDIAHTPARTGTNRIEGAIPDDRQRQNRSNTVSALSTRGGLSRRPSAEKTPALAGMTTPAMSSLRARAVAWEAPCASERHQGGLAGVCALLDGDPPQGARHHLFDDRHHTRAAAAPSIARTSPSSASALPARSAWRPSRPAESRTWIDAAEDDVGIGHRGQGSATPIGSRPGFRSRALGTNAKRPSRIDPGDTAASRSYRDDGRSRCRHG